FCGGAGAMGRSSNERRCNGGGNAGRNSRKVVEMRRVVVTGLGVVSPVACGVEPSWSRLLAGQSGARRIEGFDVSDLPCKIAMPVPRGGNGGFNPDQWM